MEERTGLKNIAGHYTLPSALTAHEIENYAIAVQYLTQDGVLKDGLKKLQDLWHNLTLLNPELKEVQPGRNSLRQLSDAIRGVASGFNTSDIHDFIHIGNGSIRNREPDYAQKLDRLQRAIGPIGWIPGRKTLHKIDLQLEMLGIIKPQEKPPRFEP